MDESTAEPLINRASSSQTAAADAAPRCKAHNKKTGAPCRAPAMANGCCHKHGGAAPPPGPMHPSYKHGRFSRASLMPPGIARETMERAAARGKAAMNLADDVNQLDGLLAELTATLQTGERGTLWDDLQQLAKDASAPDATLNDINPRLQRLATAATQTRHAWADIRETMHSKAALVKVEMDRQKIARDLADREEVISTIEAIIAIAKRYVVNQDDRSAMGRDILKLPCYGSQEAGTPG